VDSQAEKYSGTVERTAADNNPAVDGEAVDGEDESFADVCRVRIGRTGSAAETNGRDVSCGREGGLPVEERFICRRFADTFSSVVPKVKVPDSPRLSRLSLDDEVERDQRFRFSTPSVLGRRGKFADVRG
jgi:hypothetical protein